MCLEEGRSGVEDRGVGVIELWVAIHLPCSTLHPLEQEAEKREIAKEQVIRGTSEKGVGEPHEPKRANPTETT